MKQTVVALSTLFAAVALAKNCQNLTIPITATARNGVFDIAVPADEIDITDLVLNLAQQGANYSETVLTGYATVSGNFSIAATYCEPDSGPSSALQILTHGIGFDRSYWDVPYNNYNYSYVNEAVDQYGFSTFTYDRLGIGMSSHGDPLNQIQALLEVDALYQLTLLLQGGKISGLPSSFKTYSHAGHSFGSQHTYALTAMYPNITDCISLTGFSQNGSFVADFLYGANLVQANTISALSAYPNGYFANGDPQSVQYDFFSPGDFDPNILTYAYMTGEPVTIGELLTIGGETGSINTFPGAVQIVTGERDVPYCGGNCYAAPTGYPNIPSTSKKYLPDAKVFDVVIIPGAGHGLNLEYDHPTTYESVLQFLVSNGCGPGSAPPSSPPASAPTSPATWTAVSPPASTATWTA